jgi:hypothetical protein
LWLTDPDGTLVEIYARLTDEDEELAQARRSGAVMLA